MIGGIKIWPEPNGRQWTVAMYKTPECGEMDLPHIEDDEDARIRAWLDANHPTAEYTREVALIQFVGDFDRGAQFATLFKLSFSPTASVTA